MGKGAVEVEIVLLVKVNITGWSQGLNYLAN